MLTQYLAATARLLQNPPAPVPLYSPIDLTADINTARGQLAGESECIRLTGTLALVPGVQSYPFSAITFPQPSAVNGIAGPFNVWTAWLNIGIGMVRMRPRAWPWFSLYEMNNPVPVQGPPTVWAQLGQGVAGTIYVSPVPDIAYTVTVDCVGYPIPLVDDTTVEAIPYLWTDAVPFFAAYYALLAAQSTARQADADKMLERYKTFVDRARRAATPSIMSGIYAEVASPVRAGQLGMQAGGRGGQ